jgi:hypothetical protein
MSKLKVYISSTFLDLEVPRKTIMERVQKGLKDEFELTNVMEHMSGDGANRANIDICTAEVRKADVYFILVGNRYGSHPEKFTTKDGEQLNTNGKSYTEIEYDFACDTLQQKFYAIYKLELTDAFFADAGIANNYADTDINKKQLLQQFSDKINETVSAVKINSSEDLAISINNKLTEFYLKYNTKIDLDITNADRISIDRKQILSEVSGIDISKGAYVFLMEAENESDCYIEFSAKLQNELLKKEPPKNIDFIKASCVASFQKKEDQEKALIRILKESSINIYGDITNGITFDGLTQDLGTTIKNVFICFQLDCKTDIQQGGLNFAETIALFIKKINTILVENNNYRNNFFFIICVASPKNEILPQDLKDHFSGLNFFHIGRLPNVEKEDAFQWLDTIRQRNSNIEDDTKALFRLVFMGDSTFPSKYKQCIELIDKRTK